MITGKIFNIQKFSVHDGPGIRTTIFLKGCPLKCWWCHNPESQSIDNEVMYFKDKCTLCGLCIKKCPNDAIKLKDNNLINIRDKCVGCGVCSDFCMNNARDIAGKQVTVQYILDEIKKDIVFYDESGGGVTFSGGEPLQQPKFLKEVLKKCKEIGINTAVDTCGFTSWDNLKKIVNLTDLFLYDLKIINENKHKKYTGVSNKIILENLKKLSEVHNNIFVRIPIIPGINNDEENLINTCKFLSQINVSKINLLPYHKYGMDKYRRLEIPYKLKDKSEPTIEYMNSILKFFEEEGLKVEIGG